MSAWRVADTVGLVSSAAVIGVAATGAGAIARWRRLRTPAPPTTATMPEDAAA
ncbi:hypothetical protein [Curtobacterium luteum]|uniref:hypothetical protein n=1 Tax=Curtobacterium luteum TaxID=33881 RepID=UPI0037FD2210